MIPGYSEELRLTYALTPDSVVLDCGGYEGRFAAGIYDRYGCTVHVLEPVKHFYNGIVLRFGENHPKVMVHNFGIGAVSGIAEFGIQNDSTGGFADSAERETVRIEGVGEVLRGIGKDVDLMKINIEGGEWAVIPELISSGLIKGVKNIQVQWHQVGPASPEMFDALQTALSKTHRLTFDSGLVWQNWERK